VVPGGYVGTGVGALDVGDGVSSYSPYVGDRVVVGRPVVGDAVLKSALVGDKVGVVDGAADCNVGVLVAEL